MYGPHYVWMLLNSFNNNWWIPEKNEKITCPDVEMKCQIQNHFSFYHTNIVSFGKRFYDHANKVKKDIWSAPSFRSSVINANEERVNISSNHNNQNTNQALSYLAGKRERKQVRIPWDLTIDSWHENNKGFLRRFQMWSQQKIQINKKSETFTQKGYRRFS